MLNAIIGAVGLQLNVQQRGLPALPRSPSPTKLAIPTPTNPPTSQELVTFEVNRALMTLEGPGFQRHMAYALHDIGPRASSLVPKLLEIALNAGQSVFSQGAIGYALVGIDPSGSQSFPILRLKLADPDPSVRVKAAMMLGEYGLRAKDF